jgi:Concanavalin A-like lectin/glucanases superfamily
MLALRASCLLAGWVIVACTSSSTTGIEPCGMGESHACTSTDGCVGTETCGPDGRFGACICNAGGAGGSGGSAGVDASAGTGGAGLSSGTGGADSSVDAGGSGGTGGSAGTGGGAGATGSAGADGSAGGSAGAGGNTGGTGGSAGAGSGGTAGNAGAGGSGGAAGSTGTGGTSGAGGQSSISATLVAHWKFDDGSGTVAIDSSGNANHGALNGGSWTTGQKAGALHLASGDYVDVGDKLNGLTVPFSVSLWMKPTVKGPLVILASDVNPGGPYTGWHVVTPSSGVFQLSYGNGTGSRGGGAPFGALAGAWHHYTVVVEGPTTMTFYRDGTAYGPSSYWGTGGAMATDAHPFYIGSDGNTTFDGDIDDLRVYQGALSASDVTVIMNQ